MAKIQVLSRDGTGKGVARKLRREGRIPAVIYGAGLPNVNLSVERKAFLKLMETERGGLTTHRQDLEVDGGNIVPALIRSMSFDPVSDLPIHIDFLRFDPTRKIDVEIPVRVVDEDRCPGIKVGGILQIVTHEIPVQCLAGDIPEAIVVSVAELDMGESIHIHDIRLPAGVTVHSEADFTVVTLAGRKAEEAGEGEAEA